MLLLSGLGIFFSIFLLVYNKGYKSANIYLGLFLLAFNIITITHYFYIYSTSKEFLAFVLSVPLNGLAFAIGPFAFLYVRSVLTDNTYFTKFDWVHFIVFAIIFIGRLPYNLESWESKLLSADEIISNTWRSLSYSKLNTFLPLRINYTLKGIHFLLYLLAIWYLILKTKFKRSKLNEYPKQVKIINNWLFFFTFMVSVLLIFFALIILIYLNAQDKNNFEYEGNILFSLVFIGFLILILGLVLYPRILYGIPLERESLIINANKAAVSEKEKIETISFDEDYIEKIRLLLLNWIEQKKYLDAESTTYSLSKDIDLPHHHVTYFFNNVNDEKYIEWRNRKRIEYAMSLIISKKGYDKTIENLGKESGFKSYSAFIQSFRQITGKLPKDFIRDLNSL
jgi:AraC-like DNA-binding protein